MHGRRLCCQINTAEPSSSGSWYGTVPVVPGSCYQCWLVPQQRMFLFTLLFYFQTCTDNGGPIQFWLMSFKLIAPPAANEAKFFFSSSGDREAFLFISLCVGLTVGAASWPWMSDRLGRKWIFTSTLVLMGMGGLVGAGMPSFTGLCVVSFVMGFAIAGNLLIDTIILIEWVPASHQFLVCLQGLFWGLGELVAAAVGWFVNHCPILIYTILTAPGHLSANTPAAPAPTSSAPSKPFPTNLERYTLHPLAAATM